ncbi:MATE family efflux transporter [Microlunatus parietis]|uniref:Putative MATE family efflux protein n=1 Tax=Microlunatus parietis TaxID=682979 RepID=A0A7Y9I872_9ACTN|nr:MATE family efflux transporter [Microlunatus parietis]NYE72007.1 putative MATE family efflux protein [Microlunatus parietis]
MPRSRPAGSRGLGRLLSKQDREIFALAVPAFATLLSEPLLLLADSAIVGHLGTTQLAGLGLAANVLAFLVGLAIFLAYGTTGTVARRLGAGDRAGAMTGGLDGMVLAVLLGVLLCVALQLAMPAVLGIYRADAEVTAAATSYLRIAALGLPSVLLVLASTGVLRGLHDTKTPLFVVIATNLANIGLNVLFVYGLGFGIAGAALGTLIAQTGAAVVLAVFVIRAARRNGARLRFRPLGILSAARTGVWLVIRTAALQAGYTITVMVAATGGATALAAHQVVGSLWTLLAFALDSIAIAAQAIIGTALGAGDTERGRAAMRRMIGWGVVSGIAFGIIALVARPLYVGLFTPDPEVVRLITAVLVVVVIITPIAGVTYVLDGILIGAGDGRYLALAGLVALAAYLPLAFLVGSNRAGLVWLWIAWGGYMAARVITLLVRARGTAWLRTGATV